jgi:hypothetical protein
MLHRNVSPFGGSGLPQAEIADKFIRGVPAELA